MLRVLGSGAGGTRVTPLIERYRDFLPVGPDTPIVSLGEGGTPLVPLPRLSERSGPGARQARGDEPHRVLQGPRA